MNLFDKEYPPRTITLANGKQVQRPRSRVPLYAAALLARAAAPAATDALRKLRRLICVITSSFFPSWCKRRPK